MCWAGCCIGVVEEAAVSAAQTLPLPLGSGSFCIGTSLTQEIAADADAPDPFADFDKDVMRRQEEFDRRVEQMNRSPSELELKF